MPREDTVVALVSGGMDSCVMLARLADTHARVVPVYVREGLAWQDAELHHLRRFLEALDHPRVAPLRTLDLPMADVLEGHWSTGATPVPDAASADAAVYLPGRNLLLLAKAGVLASLVGARFVALGILGGNPFGDATPEFLATMRRAVNLALGTDLEVITPLVGGHKLEVLRAGADLPLHLTFSCLAPVGLRPCGDCNKCEERRAVFREAGIDDPTPYVRSPVTPPRP